MLQGYKTYTGLVIIVLGWLGLGDLITEGELGAIIDSAVQLIGIVLVWYGRTQATKKL